MSNGIPREVMVGDTHYEVRFVKAIPQRLLKYEEPGDYVGYCDGEEQVIYLRKDLREPELSEVFWHEVMHALTYEYDALDIPHELMDAMEGPLARFIRDNIA